MKNMLVCIEAIGKWMASNRLRLNPSKTEIIWLGSSRWLAHCYTGGMQLPGAVIQPVHCVRDLGVYIESNMLLSSHVNRVVGTCFFHIRQLRIIRRSLTSETAHSLIRTLIHSRLDYCNALFAGPPNYLQSRLQCVLKAAARLVLRLPPRTSVTLPMREKLHWLSIPQRIVYKLCTLGYKCQHNTAPLYLTPCCQPVALDTGWSGLRSAANGQLIVPTTSTKTFGPRGFYHSCPTAWNSLPPFLHDDSISLSSFKSKLKTELCNR